jgi:hypothetical protein
MPADRQTIADLAVFDENDIRCLHASARSDHPREADSLGQDDMDINDESPLPRLLQSKGCISPDLPGNDTCHTKSMVPAPLRPCPRRHYSPYLRRAPRSGFTMGSSSMSATDIHVCRQWSSFRRPREPKLSSDAELTL